ncbi:MAG TPA: fructosamine kinase family protein [Vicinamibacterales bacterium]|nr:fructosamine kinase family protein [Vicinamibacterales bacterium]
MARLGGGSINVVERVDTASGTVIRKSRRDAPPGFFRAEADGLRALAASGTPLIVPAVIDCSGDGDAFLLIEDLGEGARAHDFDARLGAGLAALHRATASRFGFDHDNFCGLTPQPNTWTDRWIDFYRDQRLGHQQSRAMHRDLLSSAELARLDRLRARLGDWIDEPATGPSLIHGDLWSGNVHVTGDGAPALIDPAVSYSHREAELGMMTLFGGFSPRVFDAYADAWPLEPGWRERLPIYELYHLLNHLNLFGGGYRGQVMAVVDGFV